MTERPERPASAARRVDEQSVDARIRDPQVDARIRAAGAPDRDHQHPVAITERLAGAPISWGACEVPGWGAMPDADEVLAEMAQLGLRGTELGALGFLPRDSTLLKRLLERHRLALVGEFLPLVLHEPDLGSAAMQVREASRLLAGLGATMLAIAAVQDADWSAPRELDAGGWRHLAEHLKKVEAIAGEYGVMAALHPHVGTLVETADQVERALEVLDVGWCLDTGHLFIGGVDPAEFARECGERVVHVHLKDVDAALAAELREGRSSLLSATRQGLFLPLGKGAARIGQVLEGLASHGYEGWLVLEQDTAITADEPAVGGGPMRDATDSIAFLHNSAQTTQEVHR